MKYCVVCGNELSAFKQGYPQAKYCSDSCQRDSRSDKTRKLNPKVGSLPNAVTGAVGELIVSVDLMQHGFYVFRSLSPACPCDLIALRDEELWAIEVRTGQVLPSGHKAYSTNNVRADYIAVVINDIVEYVPHSAKALERSFPWP